MSPRWASSAKNKLRVAGAASGRLAGALEGGREARHLGRAQQPALVLVLVRGGLLAAAREPLAGLQEIWKQFKLQLKYTAAYRAG